MAREGAPWFYSHHVQLPGDHASPWRLLDIHAVDRNLAITEFLGGGSFRPVFHLPQLPSDRVAIEGLLGHAGINAGEQLIALAPWSRSAIKAWPQQNFREVAMKLLQRPNVRVVLLGGSSDRTAAESFYSSMPGELINFVGKFSIRQLPLLLQRMHLLIGNDSALLHLAA